MQSKLFIFDISNFMQAHLRKTFAHLEEKDLTLRTNEFLKFAFLTSQYGGGFIPLRKEVDLIWHEFILQTEEYAQLCNFLPGKRFIHHKSGNLREYLKGRDKKEVISRLIYFLPLYYQHFGPMTLEQGLLWTIPYFLMKQKKISIDQINSLAAHHALASNQS